MSRLLLHALNRHTVCTSLFAFLLLTPIAGMSFTSAFAGVETRATTPAGVETRATTPAGVETRVTTPAGVETRVMIPAMDGVGLADPTTDDDAPSVIAVRPQAYDSMSPAEIRAALLSIERSSRGLSLQGSSRHVALAFGMSAVAPGAGQIYNGQWLKAAVAIGLEAALITGYVVYRGRGLDAESDYQAYAHTYWDPARYADWLNDYVDFLEEEHGASIGTDPVVAPAGIDFTSPGAWSADERQMVRSFFNQIRTVEDEIYHPETGASFSHKLPYFAEQQYYELIGKYFQFAPGWIDYPDWRVGDEFTVAIDPEHTGSGGSKPNVQGRFLEYAADHADANTLLRRASRMSAFVVLNHLIAAIDAAITSKLHNDRLDADVSLRHDVMDEPRFQASLRWRF